MKSQAELDIDSVVDAHNRDGVEEANRVFSEITKGLRMFEGIALAQMIRRRIEDAPTESGSGINILQQCYAKIKTEH